MVWHRSDLEQENQGENRHLVPNAAGNSTATSTETVAVAIAINNSEAGPLQIPTGMHGSRLRNLMGVDPHLTEEEQEEAVGRASATLIAAAQLDMRIPWREHKRQHRTDGAIASQ